MSNMNIMPASVAADLAREEVSLEESLYAIGAKINFAVLSRRTCLKTKVFFNIKATKGALVALGYQVSLKSKGTYVEFTIRW